MFERGIPTKVQLGHLYYKFVPQMEKGIIHDAQTEEVNLLLLHHLLRHKMMFIHNRNVKI